MKSMKVARLGLIGAAVAVALLAGLMTVSAQATGGASVGSGTAAPGATVDIDVSSDVTDPGLGAYNVDVAYDETVVVVSACLGVGVTACNPAAPLSVSEAGDAPYDTGMVTIAGASPNGLTGANTLATITFECLAEGSSDLTLTVNTFSDATIGAPAAITATTSDGSVTCAAAAPVPTTEPDVTEPDVPDVVLPEVGITGNSSGSAGWLIAGLAGMGLAVLAGFGVLRLSGRRQ